VVVENEDAQEEEKEDVPELTQEKENAQELAKEKGVDIVKNLENVVEQDVAKINNLYFIKLFIYYLPQNLHHLNPILIQV
jgi:hypothetical protein